jgi:transcriptional regulator with XRE-family HTH domain
MPDELTRAQQREATHILGEMAASRLFAIIHQRLEELQSKGDFTQVEIAARLGVSEQLVSRWLREPRNMTVRGAGRLLGALDAHLCFELERFEDVLGQHGANASGSVLPASAPRVVVSTTSAAAAPPPVGKISAFRAKAVPA